MPRKFPTNINESHSIAELVKRTSLPTQNCYVVRFRRLVPFLRFAFLKKRATASFGSVTRLVLARPFAKCTTKKSPGIPANALGEGKVPVSGNAFEYEK